MLSWYKLIIFYFIFLLRDNLRTINLYYLNIMSHQHSVIVARKSIVSLYLELEKKWHARIHSCFFSSPRHIIQNHI